MKCRYLSDTPHDDVYPDDFDHMLKSDLDSAKDWLDGLIVAIYEKGDISMMEEALDELTGIFDMKLPETKPKLMERDRARSLYEHLGYQRAVLDLTREVKGE